MDKMKSDRGTLIVLEGVDGSGKTSHIRRLSENLRTAGIDAATVSYKEQPWFQEAFKNELATPDAWREAEFFACAFNRLVDYCINPLLDEGRVVLVDRYVLSYFAYQSFHGIAPTLLSSNLTGTARCPDLLILLEVSLDTALVRCRKRTAKCSQVDFVPFQLTDPSRLRHVIAYFQSNVYPGTLVISEKESFEEAANTIWSAVEQLVKL